MRIRRHWAVAGFLLIFLLTPRDGAAFWRWLHELSGPKLMGFGVSCKPFAPTPFGDAPREPLFRRRAGGRAEECDQDRVRVR